MLGGYLVNLGVSQYDQSSHFNPKIYNKGKIFNSMNPLDNIPYI